MSDLPRFGYFGHHKCASTWIQYLIHGLCAPLALRHEVLPTPASFGGDLVDHLRRNRTDFLCYTNAEWPRVAPLLGGMKAFHVVRDPRDMVTSAYFSHKLSHISDGWPELADLRNGLTDCTDEEGLIRTIDNLDRLPTRGDQLRVLSSMLEWPYGEHPDIMELRYEDMVRSPYETWVEVLGFLGLVDLAPFGFRAQSTWLVNHVFRATAQRTGLFPDRALVRRLPLPVALRICFNYSFRRISGGRKLGTENAGHHFRKGTPGDWRNHFTPAVVDYFKARTGQLLVRLGYEADGNWSL